MTDATSCPSDATMAAMLDGALAEVDVARLERHFDDCAACATTTAHLADLLGESRRIGRYQLDVLMGAGGMGQVFSAWDPQLERAVAVKLIRPDLADGDAMRARLLAEARTLARLAHPNVLAVYDAGATSDAADAELYIVTERVEGETLARWQPAAPVEEIVAAYAQVARGLHAAHEAGIVHRDVKPTNLFRGHDGRVRVGDFGLASASEGPDLGRVGTPPYLAPEVRHGAPATAASDQYACCLALAEALTKRRPPPDTAAAGLRGLGAPAAIATCLARGLRRDPARRFADCAQLAAALEGAQRDAGRRARGQRSVAVTFFLVIAVVAVALACVGVVVWKGAWLRPREVGVATAIVGVWASVPVTTPVRDGRASDARPTTTPQAAAHTNQPPRLRSDDWTTSYWGPAALAAEQGAGERCLALLARKDIDTIKPTDPRIQQRYRDARSLRARCLMLAGKCDEGAAALTANLVAAPGMSLERARQSTAVLLGAYCKQP